MVVAPTSCSCSFFYILLFILSCAHFLALFCMSLADQEDPYSAVQQQQLINPALAALGAAAGSSSSSTGLSALGGGYAALYNKQGVYAGGLHHQAAAGQCVCV